jgi:hypothetical protein
MNIESTPTLEISSFLMTPPKPSPESNGTR